MFNLNILIVDDLRDHLNNIKEKVDEVIKELNCPGCEIYAYDNYDDAVKFINNNRVDLAILDLCLNEDDSLDQKGLYLGEKIKNKYPTAHCVLVTGHFTSTLKNEDKILHFNKVIEKADNYLEYNFPVELNQRLFQKGFQEMTRQCSVSNYDYFVHKHKDKLDGNKKMWALGRKAKELGMHYFKIGVPVLPKDSVLVETHSVGICGTDVNLFDEVEDSILNYDQVEFHESLGKIIWKGEDVEDDVFCEGDWVIPVVRRCQSWDKPKEGEATHFNFKKCRNDIAGLHNRYPDKCPIGRYPQAGKGKKVGYLSRGTGKCHGFGSQYFLDQPEWLIKIFGSQEERG